jgi:hypothetical protein
LAELRANLIFSALSFPNSHLPPNKFLNRQANPNAAGFWPGFRKIFRESLHQFRLGAEEDLEMNEKNKSCSKRS